MTKQEIIDKLNAQGVTFDPAANKAELEALLNSSPVPPGDAAAANAGDDKPEGEGANVGGAEAPVDTPKADPVAIAPVSEFLAERETLPESEIIAKVRAGLTREQAIEVINNQRAHDGKKPLSAAELIEAGANAGDIPEDEILAKVRAGLTRDQAIEVIRNQRAHEKVAVD